MQLTKIDWPWKPLFVWNPITGCKRGCSYCYAKKNWNRLHRKRVGCEFETITEYPERFEYPFSKKNPCDIFINSMSDPEWWTEKQKKHVKEIIYMNEMHTFFFLTKYPTSYIGIDWPRNVILGLTLEHLYTIEDYCKISCLAVNPNRLFLSVEPITGPVFYSQTVFSRFIKVIVGPMTGNGAIKPKQEWIDYLKSQIPEEELYLKKRN